MTIKTPTLCLLLFVLLSGFSSEERPSYYDREAILDFVTEYIVSLKIFINLDGEESDAQLFDMMDKLETDFQNHYFDIPGRRYGEKFEAHRYYSIIKTEYSGSLQFEPPNIEDITIEDCVEKLGGGSYATVKFPKTFIIDGQRVSVQSIIKVNVGLKELKITELGLPESFRAAENCLNAPPIEKDRKYEEEQDNRFREYRQKGDEAMASQQYIIAKGHYENALAIHPDDAALRQKLEQCKRLISAEQLRQRGDQYYAQGEYRLAIEQYEEARKAGGDAGYLSGRIRECNARIDNYQRYKTEGDRLYAAEAFEQAKAAYQKALEEFPTDRYCRNRISNCDEALNDPRYFASELKKAADFFNRRKYEEGFRILNKYVASGRLPAEAYYAMGSTLYSNQKGIQRDLNYSTSDAKAMGVSYLWKATRMGSEEARNFLRNNVSKKLLNDLK